MKGIGSLIVVYFSTLYLLLTATTTTTTTTIATTTIATIATTTNTTAATGIQLLLSSHCHSISVTYHLCPVFFMYCNVFLNCILVF